MKREVNIIAVFDSDHSRVLMCKRRKDPYQGLLNLVGGKIKPGEGGLCAAYRELEEETSITKDDIKLHHLMDFVYYLDDIRLEVYFGFLQHPVEVHGEENKLLWMDRNQNFFDRSVFAGKGNLGHVFELIKEYENQEK